MSFTTKAGKIIRDLHIVDAEQLAFFNSCFYFKMVFGRFTLYLLALRASSSFRNAIGINVTWTAKASGRKSGESEIYIFKWTLKLNENFLAPLIGGGGGVEALHCYSSKLLSTNSVRNNFPENMQIAFRLFSTASTAQDQRKTTTTKNNGRTSRLNNIYSNEKNGGRKSLGNKWEECRKKIV